MAFVISMSLVLSGWHTLRMRRIVDRLSVESTRTASKTQEVAFERRRVDRLLNEMMPPSIATQLKV
jgi:Heme NO binding associated